MNPLRYSPLADEEALRAAIVAAGQIAYDRGLLAASDGNISVRLPDGTVLITPAGLCKGRLDPGDLLVVDLDGRQVRAAPNPGLRASSEQPMHLEVYRQRPDVQAVVHAHPPYATALTVAGRMLRNDLLPEVIALLGAIPVSDYALPSSEENAVAVRTLIVDHDAIMLRQHGSLTVGRSLEEALINLERLEHAAKVQALAEMIGTVTSLPAGMRAQLWALHAAARASQPRGAA